MKTFENVTCAIKNSAYWIFIFSWIVFLFALYSSPGGILGNISDKIFEILKPSLVTVIVNTLSIVGAYIATRIFLLSVISCKTLFNEIFAVAIVFWFSFSMGLSAARCEIYVLCADDIKNARECEVEWDRQGPNCN